MFFTLRVFSVTGNHTGPVRIFPTPLFPCNVSCENEYTCKLKMKGFTERLISVISLCKVIYLFTLQIAVPVSCHYCVLGVITSCDFLLVFSLS